MSGKTKKHDRFNLFVFSSRRGMHRRCAGTRSWEKKWQREKPQQVLRPTPQTPSHHPRPRGTPLSPPLSHMSPPFHPPAILPHTTMKLPQPETPPRDSGRFKWGWGWTKKNKSKNDLKKERLMSPAHSSQKNKKKRMFLLRLKWEEEKKKIQLTSDSGYWFFVNTSFFVIYSTIQAAKVLIAVCHFFLYKFPHLAYIWM